MFRLTAALALLCLSACASGTPAGARVRHLKPFGAPALARKIPRAVPAEATAEGTALSLSGGRAEVVEVAKALVGKRSVTIDGRSYPADCTGLVSGVYAKLSVSLLDEAQPGDNAVTAMYRFTQRHGRVFDKGRPAPGDLVFFRETYDQNKDGRANDGLTHIGIVEEARTDGTVIVIHRVTRGVVRYHMNLLRPSERRDPATGRVLNDALRATGPARREVLTGQLFAAFGSLLPAEAMTARR